MDSPALEELLPLLDKLDRILPPESLPDKTKLYLVVDNGISLAVQEWDRGQYLNPYNKNL